MENKSNTNEMGLSNDEWEAISYAIKVLEDEDQWHESGENCIRILKGLMEKKVKMKSKDYSFKMDDKTRLETIVSEYEKSQKNIQPVWIGEGWYKGTPNSFNYFSSGFEAGMEFYKQLNIAKQVMVEDSEALRNLSK